MLQAEFSETIPHAPSRRTQDAEKTTVTQVLERTAFDVRRNAKAFRSGCCPVLRSSGSGRYAMELITDRSKQNETDA